MRGTPPPLWIMGEVKVARKVLSKKQGGLECRHSRICRQGMYLQVFSLWEPWWPHSVPLGTHCASAVAFPSILFRCRMAKWEEHGLQCEHGGAWRGHSGGEPVLRKHSVQGAWASSSRQVVRLRVPTQHGKNKAMFCFTWFSLSPASWALPKCLYSLKMFYQHMIITYFCAVVSQALPRSWINYLDVSQANPIEI